jgi:ubiquinone/menaquinone biosynthesis C-methylase UbiE
MTTRTDRIGKVYKARWHRQILFPDWLRRQVQKPQRFLSPLVKPGMTVADIGCGMGFYTVELARLVGNEGRVIAVDLQQQMLERARRKATRLGLSERIEFVQCTHDDIKLSSQLDFALTMWVVHEAADRLKFLRQIAAGLKPSGKYLLAEYKKVVPKRVYIKICSEAASAGLCKIAEPQVGLSYAAVFERAN